MSTVHIPVMLEEILEILLGDGGKSFIDCTLGTGGHSLEILSNSSDDVRVIGIDKDEKSLAVAKERLKSFSDRIVFIHGGFEDLDTLIEPIAPEQVSGILFDLGMSSFQLDDSERGFSFRTEGPLDMRFDVSQERTAEKVINESTKEKLFILFKKLGEEKWSRRLSRVITERISRKPFETTTEFSDFIRKNIPRRAAHKTLARLFQAIRISVNDELSNLERGLVKAFTILSVGGKMVVVSYHSLEDRIVKNFFRAMKRAEVGVILNPRCARPTKTERMSNRRSRSARMRAFKKNRVVTEEMREQIFDGIEFEKNWEEEGSD
jgi:16S rRNA (cytosine1402-N4)-methyltransferase